MTLALTKILRLDHKSTTNKRKKQIHGIPKSKPFALQIALLKMKRQATDWEKIFKKHIKQKTCIQKTTQLKN